MEVCQSTLFEEKVVSNTQIVSRCTSEFGRVPSDYCVTANMYVLIRSPTAQQLLGRTVVFQCA